MVFPIDESDQFKRWARKACILYLRVANSCLLLVPVVFLKQLLPLKTWERASLKLSSSPYEKCRVNDGQVGLNMGTQGVYALFEGGEFFLLISTRVMFIIHSFSLFGGRCRLRKASNSTRKNNF